MIIIKKTKLVTTNVYYYIPDYPGLVNMFLFQCEDYVPDIPKINKFLKYWKDNNLAVIKEIIIAHSDSKEINYTDYYKKL